MNRGQSIDEGQTSLKQQVYDEVAAYRLAFAFDKDAQSGGIAQLVERQLCKLDVWGSNPHASTL